MNEGTGGRWNRHLRIYDFLIADFLPIQLDIRVVILGYGRAFKIQPGKSAPRPRVGKDLGAHLNICHGGGRTAHGTAGNGSFPTQLEFVAEQVLHTVFVHHEHDDVGFVSPYEKAKFTARDAEGAGSAPADATSFATRKKALAVLSADDKSTSFQVRNDHHAGRLI